MTELPILFSAPMVRALLDGSKTQTRRLVKPEGAHHLFQFRGTTAAAGADEPTGDWAWCGSSHVVNKHIRCPHGKPGDRLWGREAFRLCAEADAIPPRDTDAAYRVWYEADAPHQPGAGKLRPSMFMPRWASRITLEVTGVRVERLQDISAADAIAEGISEFMGGWWCKHDDAPQIAGMTPQEGYRHLWERINGPRSWDANPWVWAIDFKRVKP